MNGANLNAFKTIASVLFFGGVVCLLHSRCSSNDHAGQATFQGTWKGIAICNRTITYRVYVPMLEDSLTKMKDSIYVIPDVLLDVGVEEARFFGVPSIPSVPQTYSRNGNGFLFQKKPVSNELLYERSRVTAHAAAEQLYGALIKLDADCLVMRVTSNDPILDATVLKLTRQVK